MKNIKYLFLLIGLLLGTINGYSQAGLSDSIVVVYYYGVEYYEGDTRGVHDFIDSVILIYNDDNGKYSADTYAHWNYNYPYENGDFKDNINKQPKKTLGTHIKIDKWEVSELIDLVLGLNEYHKVLQDTSRVYDNNDSLLFIELDTTYIPEDFTIDSYEIDSNYFQCLCSYYEPKIIRERSAYKQKRTCNDPIQFDKLLTGLINELKGERIISSYRTSISVFLKYDGIDYRFYQHYPGELNIKWHLSSSKNNRLIKIIDPMINGIIAEMLPKKRGLLDYRNIKLIIESYLFSN